MGGCCGRFEIGVSRKDNGLEESYNLKYKWGCKKLIQLYEKSGGTPAILWRRNPLGVNYNTWYTRSGEISEKAEIYTNQIYTKSIPSSDTLERHMKLYDVYDDMYIIVWPDQHEELLKLL
jgi:hypothetical protein